MEWTGWQQISFLLYSVLLGCGQGLLLDVITGIIHFKRGKRLLWSDVIFGPLAAVITFLGALVIMDGQLHPLLLCGVLLGMVCEHVLIGVWIGRGLWRGRQCVEKYARFVWSKMSRVSTISNQQNEKRRRRSIKRVKKAKKT